MIGRPFKLFTVHGIAVKADLSWLVILALVGWSFWGRAVVLYERSAAVAVPMALVSSVLFFGSVLAHELAHALEAQRRGVHVGGITLFLFGGATETRFDVKRPVDELALTAAGPLTSFVLAGVLGAVAISAGAVGWAVLAETVGVVAWLNLALGCFNLLPGAPLDGGRILRAIVWKVTGDRRRSVIVAADAGRVVAGVIMAIGAVLLFTVVGFLSGVWMVFIGWFLFRAATWERVHAEIEELLEGWRAEQFVETAPAVPALVSVDDALHGWFARFDSDAFLVEEDGAAVGFVDVDAVRSVPRGDLGSTPVRGITRPFDDLPRVDHAAPARALLEALPADHGIVVTDGPTVVGLVTTRRMLNVVDRLRRVHHAGRPPASAGR